ncbi:protein of unknown function [Cupriavidus taiwanensis]|nr:protein of unknown function [Cupriavidus taiwanensis]
MRTGVCCLSEADALTSTRRWRRMTLHGCGFNRSMQHTKGFASLRGAANEAKTADLLHRDPKGTDVGTVAQR